MLSILTIYVSAEPVTVENGQFSWISQDGAPALSDINIKVQKGSLVAVVGPVGAGKSSLLSAILGEMYKQSGSVNSHVSSTLERSTFLFFHTHNVIHYPGQYSVRASAGMDKECNIEVQYHIWRLG